LKKETVRDHLNNGILKTDTEKYNDEHLMNQLEEFLKKKMIENVCCGTMMDMGDDDAIEKTSDAPDKLREAYAFTFDTQVGLDVFNEEERLYKFLHERKHITPTHLKTFNKLIKGGYFDKSLMLFLAETNLGKSLIMASLAVGNILSGHKVLYISCELSEESTAERVLANVFDVTIDELKMLSKEVFHMKYEKFQKMIKNNFIIKEYPSKTISAHSILNLFKELELKKGFIPDVVYVDQIENMNSIHKTKLDNSYSEMKKITNEVRAVAVEKDVPIISSIQTNRDAFGKAEVGLGNAGESIGFVQLADIVVGVTQPDGFRQIGKYIWEILKNRQGINNVKITVRVNYEKMRIFDDEDSELVDTKNGNPEKEKEKKKKASDALKLLKKNDAKREERVEKAVIDWD
jgi:KaiC/GvpD/RAD55 family RecA-like ATPase